MAVNYLNALSVRIIMKGLNTRIQIYKNIQVWPDFICNKCIPIRKKRFVIVSDKPFIVILS